MVSTVDPDGKGWSLNIPNFLIKKKKRVLLTAKSHSSGCLGVRGVASSLVTRGSFWAVAFQTMLGIPYRERNNSLTSEAPSWIILALVERQRLISTTVCLCGLLAHQGKWCIECEPLLVAWTLCHHSSAKLIPKLSLFSTWNAISGFWFLILAPLWVGGAASCFTSWLNGC